MSSGKLPRDLLKWILALDLSFQIKNPKRDFANGFLIAEILCRYFPTEICMHSFENITCTERKKSNWHLLNKFLKKYGFAVDTCLIEDVMTATDPSAAIRLLHLIHSNLHSTNAGDESSKEKSKYQSTENSNFEDCNKSRNCEVSDPISERRIISKGSTHYKNTKHFLPPIKARGSVRDITLTRVLSEPALKGTGRIDQKNDKYQLLKNRKIITDELNLQKDIQVVLKNPEILYFVNKQFTNGTNSSEPINQDCSSNVESVRGGDYGFYSYSETGEGDVTYFNKSRISDFKPYTVEDYRRSNFDVKQKKGYWELGKLGPDLNDPVTYDKRKNYVKVKQFALSVMQKNKDKARLMIRRRVVPPQAKDKKRMDKGVKSGREKAIEFAKSVPRPWLKNKGRMREEARTEVIKDSASKNTKINAEDDESENDAIERRKKVMEIIQKLKLKES